jgi:hypothetical protein
MTENDVAEWFADYLEVFAACGRGEIEPRAVLAYWAVPLLLTTGDRFSALMTEDDVVAVAQQQVEGMLAARYHRTEVLGSEITVLNATSALYRGEFARRTMDGDEVRSLTATYLITDGDDGRRISVLAVHAP